MKKIIFFLIITICLQSTSYGNQELINEADNGDPIAQNNVGYSYLYGMEGFEKDIDKAIKYLNMAAEQDQVNAMTTVGWVYFSGEFGAPQINEEALYWTQRASDLGCATASYNMGFFYYSGVVGLEQDLIIAKKFWLLSAAQYLDETNICDVSPNELLKEINDYNPEPSEEMIKLRNLFISLITYENA